MRNTGFIHGFVLLVVALTLIPALALPQAADVHAQEPPPEFPPELLERLQSTLERRFRLGDIPGVTVLIDTPHGVFAGAVGVANVDHETPLTPDMPFRVGSITKMFTATLMLQLAEQGRLSLDDTLDVWLPDIAAELPHGDAIMLRQLLNHTAGVFDYTTDHASIREYLADPSQGLTPQEIMDRVITRGVAQFAPGTDWAYSNTNYILAGMVIEAASGEAVHALMRRAIFAPAGMTHTYLGDAEPAIGTLVSGYSRLGTDREPIETTAWDVTGAWTAGALVSTPGDLARFVRALFRGELFADPATLEIMLDTSGTGVARYGMGLYQSEPGIWAHGGSIIGYMARLLYNSEQDIVAVMCTNADWLGDALVRRFITDPLVIVDAYLRQLDAAQ